MGETRRLVSPARVFARPTADQIWLGPSQQTALSHLSGPARTRLLIGPASSGKSSILGHMAARPGGDTVVLHCRGPKEHASQVLASLLLSAELGPWELSEVDQRNLFTVFVQQRRSQNRRVVLVIDDAHLVQPAAWEEIERLLAFQVDHKPAIDVLLAGPLALGDEVTSSPPARQMKDALIHRLDAPSQAELFDYIVWRLGRFDMGSLMTPVAGQMIARLACGRYGAVDVLCQMSLLMLRQLSLDRVDARVARQAVATLVSRKAAKLEPAHGAGPERERRLDVPPQGYLLISRGGKVLTRITLGQRTLIGRSEHNDVCLPSPYLSRHHAVIVGTPEGYYVVDLNSVNGLQLNGRPVERAVLCDQDVLAVGSFRLKVQIPEWLAHGNPFPEADSLADTAVMPDVAQAASSMWRVK
ncbi:MAG TPA: FHA domain-containing protein [Gammaproteobacteria bacterium]|nr:FHA domain-containing protein [Gammaproteobacteria bacterium]